MYKDFFGLQKLPFNLTPDPGFLFLPSKHREALAGLTYAVLERKGFVVLTGDAGTGKTTLINSVFNRLPAERIESSIMLNPTLTASEFLESVMLDFDIPDVPASKAQRLWKLQEFLARTHQQNRLAVLVIDEAHKLSLEVLEEIRLLGNFESAADKFLQILLLGQSELDDLLNRQDLRQLKQRIALRLYIDRLTPAEVQQYIRFRWEAWPTPIWCCVKPGQSTSTSISSCSSISMRARGGQNRRAARDVPLPQSSLTSTIFAANGSGSRLQVESCPPHCTAVAAHRARRGLRSPRARAVVRRCSEAC